jgi:hypothetical protein
MNLVELDIVQIPQLRKGAQSQCTVTASVRFQNAGSGRRRMQ